MINTYIQLDSHESPEEALGTLIVHDFGEGRYPEDRPEGDPRNAYRASRVAPALLEYCRKVNAATGEPLDTSIGDILSDLMHLIDLFSDEDARSWDSIIWSARDRYLEEVSGE